MSTDSPEQFVEHTTELMLTLIDELGVEPFIVGAGEGALVALRLADEGAARATVAIGGRVAGDELQVEPESGISGPMLLIGGRQDPELSVSALEARYGA
ncbi:MAG: hypothetical protein J0H64_04870, partial [Actinobacteria bacterium]|nr:hypothetical protein [Actinomycetota bacterium]